ncbi:MAG: 16S rRNA (cytosine(1402)-N(4))-methyltransferase, partial [Pseudomonadota bacterium]
MTSPHIPVLIDPILTHIAPVSGLWVDGTMGAGGYTRALLDGGADQVVGIDRDPLALSMAADWGQAYGARLRPVQATFSTMDDAVERADGVVLDLGVSSMQLDHADRGFSFQKDGPLDMRMGGDGPTAADIVNTAPQTALEDILYHYGEERAARR